MIRMPTIPTTVVPGCGTEAVMADCLFGEGYFQLHIEVMCDQHHADAHIDREGAQALYDALGLALRNSSAGRTVQ